MKKKQINFQIGEDQRRFMLEQAKKMGLGVSEWLRLLILREMMK